MGEDSMPTVDDELVDELNVLLEDARASVEMEVAFALGATEYRERETLRLMGREDVATCIRLHEWLQQAEAPVSRRINGVVLHVLNLDRYDDRLRAFAHHQLDTAERARALLERSPDASLRDLLEGLRQAQAQHAAWCERRAGEFAGSRTIEFRSDGTRVAVQAGQTGQAESSGEHAAGWGHAEAGSNGNKHIEPTEPISEEARGLLREEEEEGPTDAGPDAPADLA
jgi:hypothetical protein